jgi:predicted O-linked N-acetylglucosamine transferase (SPINDLY family)
VEELVVENDLNYVRRAVQIGNSAKLIGAYHSGLRANVQNSPLMDVQGYMQELEAAYRTVWRKFCESNG